MESIDVFGIIVSILFGLFSVAYFALWVNYLVKTFGDKDWIWFVIIFLLPFIGIILYIIFNTEKGRKV